MNWGVDRETNPGSGKRFWQQFMQTSKPRPLEWKTTYAMDLLHSPRGIIFIIFFFKMANKTSRLIMVIMTIFFVSGRYGPCHRRLG